MMTIVFVSLVVAVTGPLLLLGVYAAASYFELSIADRLLDVVTLSLKAQWMIGCAVNLVGGLALAGLGAWMMMNSSTLAHQIASIVVLIPGGLWRAWKGFAGIPRRQRRPSADRD